MSRLQADEALIHPDCEITDCEFGRAWQPPRACGDGGLFLLRPLL